MSGRGGAGERQGPGDPANSPTMHSRMLLLIVTSDAGKSTTDDFPLSELRQLPSWPIGSIRADSPSRRSELLA